MEEIKHGQMFGGISELQKLEDEFGISVLAEEVPLPSRGKFYPKGHPFHNKETVAIRAMTAREENILLNQSYIKSGVVIDKLIEACLVDKVDASTLLVGDRNALMVWVRLVGYGSQYETEYSCPQCSSKESHTFDLNEIELKENTHGPLQEGVPEFEFVLPKLGRKVRFHLATVQDERNAMEMQKQAERLKKTRGINLAENNLATNSLKYSITAVEGKDGNFITDRQMLSRFIEYIPAVDTFALRQYMRECQPDVDLGQFVECSNCRFEGRITMPIGESFFWPDLRNKT